MIKTADKLPNMHSTEYRGLPIIIQWPKSSIRVGEHEDGTPFKSEMKADYGYIPGTKANGDEERLDVYIGPDEDAKSAYVIEQLKNDGSFDEYKVMLSFKSLEDAEEMYLAHNDEGWEETHVGDIQEIPFDDLLERVQDHQEKLEEPKTAGEHTLIEAFIKNYEHEVDFYQEVAGLAQDKLDSALQDGGIKAVVSSRAKRPSRLEKKLYKREPEKGYKTFRNITDDIIDLAGCRVALYMPADREEVGAIIQKLFTEVRPAKHFPADRGPADSIGYIADHYLVTLKPESLRKKELRYADTQIEIQVASVLMHAWAEVTHDLIYKPEKGKLTPAEMSLLKDLNDIVQMGEQQLEKLQNAIEHRTSEDLRFDIVATLEKLAKIGRGDMEEFKVQASKIAAGFNPKDIWRYGGWLLSNTNVVPSVGNEKAALDNGAAKFDLDAEGAMVIERKSGDRHTEARLMDFIKKFPPPETLYLKFKSVGADEEAAKLLKDLGVTAAIPTLQPAKSQWASYLKARLAMIKSGRNTQ